jgi:ABC-type glucose/galactose transport system permease subunit
MNPTTHHSKRHRDGRKIAGILLVAGPTSLIVLTIFLYAFTNFIFAGAPSSSDNLFGDSSPMQAILNIIFFALGATGVITWLPGLVIGIILLATRRK